MPIYSITTYRYKYDKGNLIIAIAIDKESKNLNVDKLTYKAIISLVSKMKNSLTK